MIQIEDNDAISRQAVYEVLDSMLDDSSDSKRNQLVSLDSIADEIAELPPVKQEPKTGHWSHDGSHWKNRFICSECRYKLFDEPTNYCPNCGAKMV